MTDFNLLISRFTPIIYFRPDEVCFPISIERYLSCCEVKSTSDPKFTLSNPTSAALYQLYKKKIPDLYLHFSDTQWEEKLQGHSWSGPCYVRVLPWDEGGYILVYFYLFSHTIPYKVCNCCCSLDKFAHKCDLKFIAVYVSKTSDGGTRLAKTYFGAHGTHGGMWKIPEDPDRKIPPREDIHLSVKHTYPVVAYSCHGDHSFYPFDTTYPRIFGFVWDVCSERLYHHSTPIQVYGENEKEFDPSSMGWLYFSGNMNIDGIASPSNQWWFTADLPVESNSWFKRLFCCAYF